MIIDWKKISQKIYTNLKNEISKLESSPTLWVILVWENEASISYVWQKEKYAKQIWINFVLKRLDVSITEERLINEINYFNEDKNIDWFIIQLPLPIKINTQNIINKILPSKDVDWFTAFNLWKLFLDDKSWFISCTPKWIVRILEEYDINLEWKKVCIIWRSNIVGKPLSLLLINKWATVSVCNSYTRDIWKYTLISDIVISAVGKPMLITENMVKKWSIIIDVWFNRINWKIVWDCDFLTLEKNNLITPVPWWVGPMTVAMLMENTYLSYIKSWKK